METLSEAGKGLHSQLQGLAVPAWGLQAQIVGHGEGAKDPPAFGDVAKAPVGQVVRIGATYIGAVNKQASLGNRQ
jgi:hypothetical protein